MSERPADLEEREDWERLLALLEYYGETEAGLAFGAAEWRAHCASGDPHWVGVEDDIAEIFGTGYPLMGLREGRLVGLLEKGGEPWLEVPDPELEALAARGGGRWSTTLPDGTVEYYDEWLARQPPDEQ